MKKYNNIKVQVSCVPNVERQVRKVFFDCLEDYSNRFNVPVTKEKVRIQICFVEYPDPYEYDMSSGTSHGLTVFDESEGNKILIQVRDPFLNDWENNYYVLQQFLCIMCHEFVHACQHLCGRNGLNTRIKHDKESSREAYFFDPMEMEARLLEMPYMCMYCGPLV